MMTTAELISAYHELTGKEPRLRMSARQKMQDVYGYKLSQKCGKCAHLITNERIRSYRKCRLWVISDSRATDIRKSDIACNKFEMAVKPTDK